MDRMTKEAIRYLGYGRNAVDEQTLALIKDSFEGLRSAVSPKSICRIFDLQHQSEECFQIGNIRMKSRSLGRNLKQCEKLILFGATLGTGADRLITRASLTWQKQWCFRPAQRPCWRNTVMRVREKLRSSRKKKAGICVRGSVRDMEILIFSIRSH